MKKWRCLPQVAEVNTPRPMDAAGECCLYDYVLLAYSGDALKIGQNFQLCIDTYGPFCCGMQRHFRHRLVKHGSSANLANE
jgi:hypothetical protein